MNEVISIQNYDQLRNELNKEFNTAANSFVRIGYLLKLARDDKSILEGSGYADVNEFAKAEFGLDKTQVSRFIRINDRFSLNGNTPELLPEYSEFGSAKLSLMLTLPDEINEEISPEMSKTDIQAIKEEYDEEQKITPIELALEDKPEGEPDELIALVIKHLHDEHPEPAELMKESIDIGNELNLSAGENDAKENYMPDGDKIYNIRIEGQGRFMISCKESGVTITNMRDPANKTPLTWEEFSKAVVEDISHREFKKPEAPKAEPKSKPKKVEKSKPKKTSVAPVQPEIEKAEGEVVEAPGKMDQPGDDQRQQEEDEQGQQEQGDDQRQQETQDDEGDSRQQEEKELEKDVIEQLEKTIQEIKDPEKTNWDHIKEQLFGAIHEINRWKNRA